MTTTLTRTPGWDSKVRKRVRVEVGSIRALAEEVDLVVPGADLPMVTWSRLVQHFGGTEHIETYLDRRPR